MAFIRGTSIKFIALPEILSKAPFFNRIKMFRKFKGHAVFGVNTVLAPRGQAAAIKQRSHLRTQGVNVGRLQGTFTGGRGPPGLGPPGPSPYGPPRGPPPGSMGGPSPYGPPPGQMSMGYNR